MSLLSLLSMRIWSKVDLISKGFYILNLAFFINNRRLPLPKGLTYRFPLSQTYVRHPLS